MARPWAAGAPGLLLLLAAAPASAGWPFPFFGGGPAPSETTTIVPSTSPPGAAGTSSAGDEACTDIALGILEAAGGAEMSLQAFMHKIEQPQIRRLFQDMGMDPNDPLVFFKAMDTDGSEALSFNELETGCKRPAGAGGTGAWDSWDTPSTNGTSAPPGDLGGGWSDRRRGTSSTGSSPTTAPPSPTTGPSSAPTTATPSSGSSTSAAATTAPPPPTLPPATPVPGGPTMPPGTTVPGATTVPPATTAPTAPPATPAPTPAPVQLPGAGDVLCEAGKSIFSSAQAQVDVQEFTSKMGGPTMDGFFHALGLDKDDCCVDLFNLLDTDVSGQLGFAEFLASAQALRKTDAAASSAPCVFGAPVRVAGSIGLKGSFDTTKDPAAYCDAVKAAIAASAHVDVSQVTANCAWGSAGPSSSASSSARRLADAALHVDYTIATGSNHTQEVAGAQKIGTDRDASKQFRDAFLDAARKVHPGIDINSVIQVGAPKISGGGGDSTWHPSVDNSSASGGRGLEHICDGFEEQWKACGDLGKCPPCKPQDCMFGPWTEWELGGGCSGLKFRKRQIALPSNECGKPCGGHLEESAEYPAESCKLPGADCVLSQWAEWSACVDQTDQAMRTRRVEAPPVAGGAGCRASLKETRPCGGVPATDCMFSEWREWTSCSATCGEGRHTRMRRVEHEAEESGRTCRGATLETAACMTSPCPGKDCKVSDWSMWTGCESGQRQTFRRREMLERPVGAGAPCPPDLVETVPCPVAFPSDCVIGEWQDWSACDRTCGMGQRLRQRDVLLPAVHGGRCPSAALQEAAICQDAACRLWEPADCLFSDWTGWSDCSTSCGPGNMRRARQIMATAAHGGIGCAGALSEVKPCIPRPCDHADCVWDDWQPWSRCSATCGGGIRNRSRSILDPGVSGHQCEALRKSEVEGCATHSCEEGCQDGIWSEWEDWSACSATCSASYRLRRRRVLRQPNHCGRTLQGDAQQYERCHMQPACAGHVDCQLAEWSEWSECSNSCSGIRERTRYITVYPSGAGEPCHDAPLHEVGPCSPEALNASVADAKACEPGAPTNCVMGEWQDWTECSSPCGGGQKARQRKVVRPSANGGRPCWSSLVIVAGCNRHNCSAEVCQDCVWEEWSEWSNCTRCGGQRHRSRGIRAMANHCGKPCDLGRAKETDACGECTDRLYCAWTEWSAGACQPCGYSAAARTRKMGLSRERPDQYLFSTGDPASCSGSEVAHELCPFVQSCPEHSCEPVNCQFSAWSEWAELKGEGLCERWRNVAQMNNECGTPCRGPTVMTSHCTFKGPGLHDCILSAWSEWSWCSQMELELSQRYRSREIKQEPSFGGQPCVGVLNETVQCGLKPPAPCEFGAWQDWGDCNAAKCRAGFHSRARSIAVYADEGGHPCVGRVREMQQCNNWDASCSGEDCKLSEWGPWTDCGLDGQRYRDRQVAQQGGPSGHGCVGSLHETETCGLDAVDCRISQWTAWDDCDRTCGDGQTTRQRQIERFPRNGGRTCPTALIETKGCKLADCNPRDAKVSEWTEWAVCSATCGSGMQSRTRQIISLRDAGGKGLMETLGEARTCTAPKTCEVLDCVWGNWTAWSKCSKTCGGGTRKRTREIEVFPTSKGKQCDASGMQEVEACNKESCDPGCVDGLWGDWTSWGPCSATCDGGTTFRTRSVARMATACGVPAAGDDHQTGFCNLDVRCVPSTDCQFADWGDWSDCSATCNGAQERSRSIRQFPKGRGANCRGALQEHRPCNPQPGEKMPLSCNSTWRQDCVLDDWSPWSVCSATCGGGQHVRSRKVVQHPANGGKDCEPDLSEMAECGRGDCGGPKPIDCQLGDWKDWSECNQCDGERTRMRRISLFPQHGGDDCPSAALKEVGNCKRSCSGQQFCAWNVWGAWSECTATCGTGGRKRRRRDLHFTQNAEEELPASVRDVIMQTSQLQQRAEELEAMHPRELLLSFAMGSGVFFVVIGGLRAVPLLLAACGPCRRQRYLVRSTYQGYTPYPAGRASEDAAMSDSTWRGALRREGQRMFPRLLQTPRETELQLAQGGEA